jgi:hypothetical protein
MRFKDKKAALLIIALSIVVIVLVWMFISRHRETETVQKQLPKAESHESINKGENVISLSEADQNKAGIVVSSLKPVFHREELQAYGTVLQPKALIDIRNSYIAARASVDKALTALDASRKEYERLKTLNADNKNISDKVLQSAEAVFRADEANAFASREKLKTVKDAAVLQWGRIIAGWIFDFSPAFQRLIDMKDVLIQVTLPLDVHIESAPGTINIQSTRATLISAKLIAQAPITDPRTQGINFFYAAPSSYTTRLIPGMNVQALLPLGSKVKGVVIPFSSVIWLHGKAWAYRQKDKDHFDRREVSTLNPVQNGYFVSENFTSGDQVVIKGAQILLSEEFLKVQTGGVKKREEGDED